MERCYIEDFCGNAEFAPTRSTYARLSYPIDVPMLKKSPKGNRLPCTLLGVEKRTEDSTVA